MEGFESTWALTSALMRLTGGEGGEGSWGLLGLDGRRPLRPFRLSVRTTRFRKEKKKKKEVRINHLYKPGRPRVVARLRCRALCVEPDIPEVSEEWDAYLLSPSRPQGTSGSGRTGTGFFCVCQQDSFYWLNRRISRFSGRCAAKREILSDPPRPVLTRPEMSTQVGQHSNVTRHSNYSQNIIYIIAYSLFVLNISCASGEVSVR